MQQEFRNDNCMSELNGIKDLITNNHADEAIKELDQFIASNPDVGDEAFFLRGNAYRKLGNWQMALNNYLLAIEINPESLAVEARRMLMDIMEFYHKDMYNQ